jgi:hypothetical protein
MKTPMEQLAEAEAHVARLKRLIAAKSCESGHEWRFVGGKNAGCSDDCRCSAPVYECVNCGECDYGENDEAREVIAECDRDRIEDEDNG